jgi:hypothetical protein
MAELYSDCLRPPQRTDAEYMQLCRGAESSTHFEVDRDAKIFEERRNGALFEDETLPQRNNR